MSGRSLRLPKGGLPMVILVVEDEILINLTVSEELQRAGHVVISAYSADQAIAILDSRNDIHLVFTDIDMPGSMDGLRECPGRC
jgi:two-component system, response regulator PdtaR